VATTFFRKEVWYNFSMQNISKLTGRQFPAGIVYHVLNRANARVPIFQTDTDYQLFEHTLFESLEQSGMPVLAFLIMPNHWHLVLYPTEDGSLSQFMSWLTNTHVKRWQTSHQTVGMGHLYQNSFKAFPVQTDSYCLNLIRYVESNALRARMVDHAEKWRWSSLWIREFGTPHQKKMLSEWPIEYPDDYISFVNEPISKNVIEELRDSARRGKPFGEDDWTDRTARQLNISLRRQGRPRKDKM